MQIWMFSGATHFQKQVADPDHFVRWMLGATKCSGLGCGGSEISVLWILCFVKKMDRGGVGVLGTPRPFSRSLTGNYE